MTGSTDAEPGEGRATRVEDPGLATVRRLLLALVLFGSAGLLVELLLLEHFQEPWQWVPLGLTAASLASGAAVWVRPGRRRLQWFRGVMAASALASLAGVFFHFRSNASLELEMDADIGGAALAWYAIRGSTPALAPGALLQLGILGLILTYGHPALISPPTAERGGREPRRTR